MRGSAIFVRLAVREWDKICEIQTGSTPVANLLDHPGPQSIRNLSTVRAWPAPWAFSVLILPLGEQLLEVDDVAVVLVLTIEAIGAADGLEQSVIVHLVVEIYVGATRDVYRVYLGEHGRIDERW
jgi:hypothetical protein